MEISASSATARDTWMSITCSLDYTEDHTPTPALVCTQTVRHKPVVDLAHELQCKATTGLRSPLTTALLWTAAIDSQTDSRH